MTEKATLAGGCFWCTEAVFRRLKGVHSAVPGYTGGHVPNPSYEAVCDGSTGHAEAVEITFDPDVISYRTLLDVFFHLHDPTTLNRQGEDYGTQYRSAIYYHDEDQRRTAEEVIAEVNASGVYQDPVVTEVKPASEFYPAESYHRDYYERNRMLNPYCMIVIDPKIRKLYQDYGDLVNVRD
ncbi:MAG TPA: peptide-methionine (S)-S-oxide reductase MsrA [Dehalococcoidia bacterium]|nr:peptide-methionine (S)-S-oxide reductase MsrA [Dehalococcoidia bacterium]